MLLARTRDIIVVSIGLREKVVVFAYESCLNSCVFRATRDAAAYAKTNLNHDDAMLQIRNTLQELDIAIWYNNNAIILKCKEEREDINLFVI